MLGFDFSGGICWPEGEDLAPDADWTDTWLRKDEATEKSVWLPEHVQSLAVRYDGRDTEVCFHEIVRLRLRMHLSRIWTDLPRHRN